MYYLVSASSHGPFYPVGMVLVLCKLVSFFLTVKPVSRPIHLSPKVSIQPKPLITALPIARAAAALQTKTIIIQPVQTTIVPVVKPAPVTIQPAPPAGQEPFNHSNNSGKIIFKLWK